ncbi:MAG: PASTA domain-containing protein [Fibrobacteraceae bacterium]|nr:PASTA domain-containing protein [Fibrobacteraceae bacterium]
MNKLKAVVAHLRKMPVVKAFLVWIVLLVIIAFAVDKILMPIFAGALTSTGEVPALEGLSKENAEKALEEAGFKYEWTEEGRYSSLVPAGMVLVQMPKAGRIAKKGRTVKLTQSLGLREVDIPDLRGKSQKQAEISITRAGLVVGPVVKGAHRSIPRGVVIRTIPGSDEKARVGDTVRIVISAGATTGKQMLPDFSGMQIEAVYGELEKLGFKVGRIKRQKGENGEAPGTVLETSPKEGDYLPPDSKVNFVIVD